MKHSFALVVATVTLLAAPALAQTVPPAAISVTGEATVRCRRTRRRSTAASVGCQDRTRSLDANNAAMGKVLLALKGAGSTRRITDLAAVAAAAIRAEPFRAS